MIRHVPKEDQLLMATGNLIDILPDTQTEISVDTILKITDVYWTNDGKRKCDPGNFDECYVQFEVYSEKWIPNTKKYVTDYLTYKGCRNLYLARTQQLNNKVAIVVVYDMDIDHVTLVSREDSRHALMMARIKTYGDDWNEEVWREERELDDEDDLEASVNDVYYDRLWGDAHKTLIDICEVKGSE